MAAQELEADQAVASVAGTTVEDLASQATAPSHALDSESLLSQPSVIVEAEPEAEPEQSSCRDKTKKNGKVKKCKVKKCRKKKNGKLKMKYAKKCMKTCGQCH